MLHGHYFWEIFPENMSLFDYNIIIIFTFFPNNTIITLQNVNNSGQMVSNFSPNFWKCPHNTIIPLIIIINCQKSPRNTLIPYTLLFHFLEYVAEWFYR